MSRLAWVVVIGIAVLVILSVVAGFVGPQLYGGGYGYGWGMGPWMMGPGMMGGFGGFGFPVMGGIWMILFWALIIGGIVWLVQSVTRGASAGASHSDTSLDIVRARYARGEITKEQFDEMRRDLGV